MPEPNRYRIIGASCWEVEIWDDGARTYPSRWRFVAHFELLHDAKAFIKSRMIRDQNRGVVVFDTFTNGEPT